MLSNLPNYARWCEVFYVIKKRILFLCVIPIIAFSLINYAPVSISAVHGVLQEMALE